MANKIPKDMQPYYEAISKMISDFCRERLNEEYEELCLKALAKLCRKRPSPLLKGRVNTWAAAIVYAVGSANFIFDKSNPHYTPAEDIAGAFGISKTTAANKAADIRKMLKIDIFNSEWTLPSQMADNPAIWYVSIDGMIVDARQLPLEYQLICFERGLIPYVPALKEQGSD